MQGIGNDYVYVNCFSEKVSDPAGTAKLVSDRHFGIGSDGLILICPSQVADFQMVMYNSDGSRAQMCGNGIRCVGKYVHDRGLTDQTTFTVETLGGIKTLVLHLREDGTTESITVDMGAPILEPKNIPVSAEGDRFVAKTMEVDGKQWLVTAVSMGNPHAVVYVEDTDSLNLPAMGPAFEHHELFPERINTEFVQVVDKKTLKMRVWERGAGETLACGTGACASLVASVLNGKCDRTALLKLLGGDLEITWDEKTGHVFMTGPAEFVFDGDINI
jgi:diaminopimelate epimerase